MPWQLHTYWHDLLAPVLRQEPPPTIPQAIVLQGTEVLLVQRATPRFWELPGGSMAAGETPEETVIREVWEETGVCVVIVEMLGWYERTGFRAHHSPVYICCPQSPLRQTLDADTLRAQYFPLQQLPRGLCPWYRVMLQQDMVSCAPRPLRHTQHLGLRTVAHCLGLDLGSRCGLWR